MSDRGIEYMAAWGAGHFKNDRAFNWAVGLRGSSDFEAVVTILNSALTSDYLKASDGWRALAAAEAAAACYGAPPSEMPEEVGEWAARVGHPEDGELVRLALAALAKVEGTASELREIWDEGRDTSWIPENQNLRDRLESLVASA